MGFLEIAEGRETNEVIHGTLFLESSKSEGIFCVQLYKSILPYMKMDLFLSKALFL